MQNPLNEHPILIRRATVEDALLLSEMGMRAFSETFGSQNTPEDMAAYLAESFSTAKQTEELSQPGSLYLIAESEGKPAGFARLLFSSTEACITGQSPVELVRLYAMPEWIGKGIGARLMQVCIETARSGGGDVIWLGVWEKNERAIRFYKKSGFVEVGTHPFLLGSDLQTDLIFEKRLE